MDNNVVRILVFVFFVLLAGLFAGSETGMYELSRLRLRLGIEKKRWSYRMLGRCLHDSPGLLLSMLIGVNLSGYIATSIITYMFLGVVESENVAAALTTLVTAPSLFLFAELIPKNVFYYRADVLLPYVAAPLYAFDKAFRFCGLVPLLKLISDLFGRLVGLSQSPKTAIGSATTRHFKGILQDTREEGIFSSVQTDMLGRVINIPSINLWSVMVPMAKVQTVSLKSNRSILLEKLRESDFTRRPVVDEQAGNIVGFINIYDVLCSSEQFEELGSFVKPIRRLDAGTPMTEAIELVQSEDLKIVLVTRATRTGHARDVGILTMKDLAEELLGELAQW